MQCQTDYYLTDKNLASIFETLNNILLITYFVKKNHYP